MGTKMDLRVWCSGPALPWKGLRDRVDQAIVATRLTPQNELESLPDPNGTSYSHDTDQIEPGVPLIESREIRRRSQRGARAGSNQSGQSSQTDQFDPIRRLLQLVAPLDPLRIAQDLKIAEDTSEHLTCSKEGRRPSRQPASSCPSAKTTGRESLAVEIGFTSLQACSDPDYARDHSIRMNTFIAGCHTGSRYRQTGTSSTSVPTSGCTTSALVASSQFQDSSSSRSSSTFTDRPGCLKLAG